MVQKHKNAGPLELDSPLEFILVSNVGRHRRVVVKSRGAGLDLIAHAQKAEVSKNVYRSIFPSFFPFLVPTDLEPIVIDSSPIDPIYAKDKEDKRPSSLTFVWRGTPNRRFDDTIEAEFERRVSDLASALADDASWQVEWILADLIDQCHRSTRAARRRSFLYVYSFWFVLISYVLAAIAIFFIDFR